MLKVNIFRLLFVALLFILILPLSVKTVLADNFNLSGKITTQSGNAVSDATVTLIDPNPNTNISSTTTDASGNYNIIVSAGTYNIQVLPPTGGNFSSLISYSQSISSDKVINFILVPSGTVTLSGHVFDPLGNVVSNTSLKLRAGNSTVAQAGTDTAGSYSLQVSSGTYELWVEGGGGQNLPPIFQLVDFSYTINQSTIVDITIPAKKIDIHVQNSAGEPISDVILKTNVSAHSNGGLSLGGNITNAYGASQYYPVTVATNNSGDTTMWLIPATTILYSIIATPPSGSVYSITTVSNITAADDAGLTVTMQQPATISGHIYGPLGDPVPNISLKLRSGNSTIAQTGTDASGSYSLQVVSGTYEFWIEGTGGPNLPPVYQLVDFNYSVSGNATVDITIPAKKINLHIENAFGNAVSNVSLKTNPNAYSLNGLILSNSITNAYGGSEYGNGYATVSTDGSGDAIMWLIPATTSPYTITATPPSGSSYSINSISNITAISDSSYTIVLQQPVTVSGHVLDPLGNPVSNTSLKLRSGNSTIAQSGTDTSGNFSMQVSAGTYELWIEGGTDSGSNSNNVPPIFQLVDFNYTITQNTVENITIPAHRLDIHMQNEVGDPLSNILLKTNVNAHSNDGLSLSQHITNAYGASQYYPTTITTNSSGDAIMWLIPATTIPYTLIATPPSGSIYSLFILNNISVTSDQTEIISLQFVHYRPVTTATLSPSADNQGNYSDPTTVTLSATAASGFTIANTNYTVDGGAQQTYTSPFTVSGQVGHTIKYWSIDNVGVFESPNTKTFTIESNVPPVISTITAPTDPQKVNTSISISATFTDGNTSDTHIATIDWGDGTTNNGTVTENNGSGTINGSHTFAAAGVYTITVKVTDNNGASDTKSYQYIVIYDESAGYVTGAGTITSPIGAYVQDPSLSGKAIFGFVSKYQNGANLPTGSTQFRFIVADFSFKSTSYDWLVVGGARAQYKGSGTINGSGDYGFILSAIDGQINGGGGTDKFRIKIIDKTTGNVIYDNQLGASDTADPTTVIDSGSITIHK